MPRMYAARWQSIYMLPDTIRLHIFFPMQTLTVLPLAFAYSGFRNLRTHTGYDKPMRNVLLLIFSIAVTA